MGEKRKSFSHEHLKLVALSCLTPCALLLLFPNSQTGSQFGHVFYLFIFLISDEPSSSLNLIGMYYKFNFLNFLILIQISSGS